MPVDHTNVTHLRITVAQVRDALEGIVADDPGYRDRRAASAPRYVDGGQPGCLVAWVLIRLGFGLGVLRGMDREHPTGDIFSTGVRIEESRHPALRRLDRDARLLLAYVQRGQDRGVAWGVIVADAFTRRRFFPERYLRSRKPWLFTEELGRSQCRTG